MIVSYFDGLIGANYKIVYADPPWHYDDKREKHKRICGGATAHYSTMKVVDICGLPVRNIINENCILFLWATFPNLQEALQVIEAWGFKYKTLGFSWIKTNKNNGKPFFGIGHYTKSNCEVCLIGIKGKPKIISNKVSSVIILPKREHSRKPDIVRQKIVELVGDLARIELFARQREDMLYTDGWDFWGNEL